ncbi:VanZ family protein [Pontibacterium granulatum]|uniref:VanZ family protein n=1 Tax=Pontibacterium granulatum TaxID=2036029 RepID=UPI00249C8447|nr:VanZ family protein [Pontibacterium granulatum]MDI3324415.1 VanZ family protein [Pontibacterium granulatum]
MGKVIQGIHRFVIPLTVIFVSFVLWVIFEANTGKETAIFQWVRTLPYGDKVGHFAVFGLMVLMLNLCFRFQTLGRGWCQVYLGTAIVTSFAVTEEFSQYFIPSRTFDLYDLAADAVGVMLFTGLSWLSAGYLRKLERAAQKAHPTKYPIPKNHSEMT